VACRWQSTGVPAKDDTVHACIRAHRFVVVDSVGNECAELGMLDDGCARLAVRSPTNKSTISVGIEKNGQAVLDLVGPNGQVAAELGAYQDRQSWLIIQDPAKNVTARVGVDGAGRALFALAGTGGHALAEVGILGGKAEMSVFILRDVEGKKRCAVYVNKQGEPQLKLWDDQGKVRMVLMVYKNGQCAVDLLDSGNEQIRASLSIDPDDNPCVSIQDSEGRPIWVAPPGSSVDVEKREKP